MSQLRISYALDEDDGFGRLRAEVVTPSVFGVTSCWSHGGELQDFAAALSRYPISADAVPELEVGYGPSLDGKTQKQVLIQVTARPVGILGVVVVRTELRTERHSWETIDQQSVVASFATEYAQLERFAAHLRRVAAGDAESATLDGEPFDCVLGERPS